MRVAAEEKNDKLAVSGDRLRVLCLIILEGRLCGFGRGHSVENCTHVSTVGHGRKLRSKMSYSVLRDAQLAGSQKTVYGETPCCSVRIRKTRRTQLPVCRLKLMLWADGCRQVHPAALPQSERVTRN